MKAFPLVIALLLLPFILFANAEAQEIKFETADGKFKITGTVGYYVANGKPVESPTGDEKGLSVVIIRPDGKATNPVPVKILSKKTKQILFGKSEGPPLAIAPFDERKAKAHQKAWAKHLSLPVESTNSIGMKFVVIPPGEFKKGDDTVTVTKPFQLCIHEVTQSQYVAVVGANPSKFKGASNPVDSMAWNGAVLFCSLLSNLPEERAKGRSYRLATGAEWEFACRAGTATKFYFGDDGSALGEYAWFNSNSRGKHSPVGQKKSNPWGLYDMHGNVWEYTQDWYQVGSLRARRGGSWSRDSGLCTSAFRSGGGPDVRGNDSGFRVVCVQSDR
ncbi:formylglycine-generating enzyme family protein [Mariniblastus sp.]|nr:formylglycine-generating enzyme family protein [Mariniblastus sp.]